MTDLQKAQQRAALINRSKELARIARVQHQADKDGVLCPDWTLQDGVR